MEPGQLCDDSLRWTPARALQTLDAIGDRPAIVAVRGGSATRYSGGDIAALIRGAAKMLAARGIKRGDTVALWAPNSAAWVAAGLACHLSGIILAPVDAMLSADEARQQIEDTDASLTLASEQSASALGPDLAVVTLESIEPSDQPVPSFDYCAALPIALFRTSGTTGKPKMFHLSLQNIGWNVAVISESAEFSADDRILMPLPMHHVFPWISATLPSLTLGATLVLPESPTGPHLAEAMALTRPTILVGVPRLFEALLEAIRYRLRAMGPWAPRAYLAVLGIARALRRLSSGRVGSFLLAPVRRMIARDLRMVVSGGAHLKPETEDEMETLGWDVRGGYGLAETSASITVPLGGKRLGATGRAVQGCSVRIDHPNDRGIGEILVKGPVVFSGYLNNPKANAAAFSDDGYFRTGDLGYLDGDGFLYVTGRMKEVIVLSGGDNIFPEDVETKYLAEPVIAEIGVLEKDGALVAVIVPDMAEIARRKLIDPEEIISIAVATVAKTLPSTWRLRGFVLCRDPLPRTRLLKLRRFMLPAIYDGLLTTGRTERSSELSPEDAAWLAQGPQKTLWALLNRQFPDNDLSLDGYVSYDLGLDSFGWMTLSLEIEKAVGVRLSLSDIARIATIRDLLNLVAERQAEAPERPPNEAGITDAVDKWLSPRSWWETLLGWVLYQSDRLVMRALFRLRVDGIENLNGLGDRPALICPNHASDLDPLALAAALPARVRARTRWSGSRGAAFGTGFRRFVARSIGMFPVDQEAPMIAVELAVQALDRGDVQVWFPEGLLSADGRLLPFHLGVGHVIAGSQALVVPAIIVGTYQAWPRERRLPRPHPVRVIFGPPVTAQELSEGVGKGDDPAKVIADNLRSRVLSLAAENGIDLRGEEDL